MNRHGALFVASLVALAVVVAVPGPGRAAPPEYVLTAKPARRVEAVQSFDVTYPKFKAKEWIVYASAAPELPSQQKVSSKLSLEARDDTELSKLKRPVLRAKVTADDTQRTQLHYTVTYQATLLERRLVPLPRGTEPPKVEPLTETEKKWYVAATTMFYDYEAKPFQAWLDKHGLRVKRGEGEVEFARRVFLVIADTCTYEARQDNDRHASAVCRSGKSDCGGHSVLFVAALRANGIPARSLVGNWTESAKPGQKIGDIPFTQQHVRTEFYAAGVGWVPAEPSGAVLFKGTREARLQYCFGFDNGNFLVKQVDYDVVLDGGPIGEQTVPWVWGGAWAFGEGELTNQTVKDDWKVRPLRLGK
jgi:transglutaminase-like putative cysteine protease